LKAKIEGGMQDSEAGLGSKLVAARSVLMDF
jgi:hypothetical protein